MTISRFRDVAVALVLALMALVAIPAVLVLLTDEADALLVIAPAKRLLAAMPEGSGLLVENGWSAVIAGGRKDIAWDAYAAGALLVLPARRSSCMAWAEAAG